MEEKERQGLTISLCLPAYNEEKTIGKEIVIFKSELHDRYPLVDEIAVVDSGSTDRTREIAASFGAEVFWPRITCHSTEHGGAKARISGKPCTCYVATSLSSSTRISRTRIPALSMVSSDR